MNPSSPYRYVISKRLSDSFLCVGKGGSIDQNFLRGLRAEATFTIILLFKKTTTFCNDVFDIQYQVEVET